MNYEEFKKLSVGQTITRVDTPEQNCNIIGKIDHSGYLICVVEDESFGDIFLVEETDRGEWTVDSPDSIRVLAEELTSDLSEAVQDKTVEVKRKIFAKVVAFWLDDLYSEDEYDSAINAIRTELNGDETEE